MLSLLEVVAAALVGGILIVVTQRVVTPVLRRLPRSEHLGRSGVSSSTQYGGYDGGSSCESGSSSSSGDSGGGSSC